MSTRAESVSVTIYRDFLALVTETRTVELPAEAHTLQFEGVLDSLLPQSAVIAGTGRAIAESNFDYDALSPGNLLRKSVGKEVTLIRTSKSTGRESQVRATVVSVNDGVTLRTTEGKEVMRCSGLPERLSFEEVPGELRDRPMLSVRLAAGTPGKYTVKLSYVALGFGWNADYIARLTPGASTLDLAGWISLHNFTDSSFANARLQLVAGRLNLLDVEENGSSPLGHWWEHEKNEAIEIAREKKLRELKLEGWNRSRGLGLFTGCYPLAKTTDGLPRDPSDSKARPLEAEVNSIPAADELDEIVVVRERHEAERESLADYQMYRLPWATDLSAHQSKQVAFLHKDAVEFERFYRVQLEGESFDDIEAVRIAPDVMVGWSNTEASGLGEPLPAGHVRVFETSAELGAREVFAGEARLPDTAVGTPVELSIGNAAHLVIRRNEVPEPSGSALVWAYLTRHLSIELDFDIDNDKPVPALLEIRQAPLWGMSGQHVKSQQPHQLKSGDFTWRLQIPAHTRQDFSYTLSGRFRPDSM